MTDDIIDNDKDVNEVADSVLDDVTGGAGPPTHSARYCPHCKAVRIVLLIKSTHRTICTVCQNDIE